MIFRHSRSSLKAALSVVCIKWDTQANFVLSEMIGCDVVQQTTAIMITGLEFHSSNSGRNFVLVASAKVQVKNPSGV